MAIYYCSVEAAEAGVQVRGTAALVEGRADVVLPDHFSQVAGEERLTVQLTPRSLDSRGVAATRLTTSNLIIEELGGGRGRYEVDWLVQGIRKGSEAYAVLRPIDVPGRGGTAQG
jgi:hypothetical protein